MKIYNKITFEWKDGEYVKTAEESYDYDGPVAECKGGGGGGQENYANLDRLYGIQADQAELLGSYAKNTVLPAYKGFLDKARGYGSQANQEFRAGQAGAASDAATSSADANLRDQMASMGVNPGSAEYWKQSRGIQIAGAGQKAAAMSGARDAVSREGFAREQDAVSLGMGTPTQATAAANSAASAATASGQLQGQADASKMNGISSAVRGGFNLYNAWNGSGGFADGGQVLRLNGGGFVQRMASGGVLGSRGITMPPPSQPKPLTSPVQEAVTGGMNVAASAGGGSLAHGLGKGVSYLGDKLGSTAMTDFGGGMQNAPGLKETASNLVDKALGNTVAPAANSAGMDALASTTAEEAATVAAEHAATDVAAQTAGEAAMTGGAESLATTLGSTLGTAIPVIGGGLALYSIGNAAGWWADGGEVEPGAVAQTGDVSGPGGPKDDLIPAMLSDGEFVMPVGAVKKFGLDKLEKMRQAGLEFEKQLGISKGGHGQSRTGSKVQR